MSETKKTKVLIAGGGSAGISVASRLAGRLGEGEITILDPAEKHYYQPLWTLVGGGDADKASTERDQKDLIPGGCTWVQEGVAEFLPDQDCVVTTSGQRLGYDVLVVALGIKIDWGAIPGLMETLGRDGVCSNYSFEHVDYTWECLQKHDEGPAFFTHPDTPIKCGGAPQKIMYLAAHHWRRRGVQDRVSIDFCIADPVIFKVERYAKTLMRVVERNEINVRFRHDLRALRPQSKEAVFMNLDTQEEVVLPYGMIHVTPKMFPPDVIRNSPLGAEDSGWCEVDAETCRHVRFPKVFSLGDSSNLPTSKTGAAIRKQAPVVAENVLAYLDGKEASAQYDGYTSCPLVTGYGRLVLAEFGYDGALKETFPFDQSKERRSMYVLKKHLLPRLYWDYMLKGKV